MTNSYGVSNNIRTNNGKQRKANEYKTKSSKSGVCMVSTMETLSSNDVMNVFNSDYDSLDIMGF